MPPVDSQLSASLSGDDTIVAISTPPGRSGLGVVRLSGAESRAVAGRLLRPGAPQQPRVATLSRLVDEREATVDRVVATWFSKPRSYTGEDVVELSCHGSPAVLGFAVERAVGAGARLAEPGEFTMRAFRNGRLDLPQAEAVRDLIDATTVYQAQVAMQQLDGALSRRLAPLKQGLTELIALLEAGIDFAEDDVDVAPDDEILRRLDPLRAEAARLVAGFEYGKVVRSGVTLAIIGRPNVGKSSLFNRLLEQERSIVTELAGTTRDVVSETAQIEGLPVTLLDTAGVRATSDVVEAEGVERSWSALADADLILAVIDLADPLEEADRELIARAQSTGRSVLVGNKADLPRRAEVEGALGGELHAVSAASGAGVDELRKAIASAVAPTSGDGREAGFITSLRHAGLLRECRDHLEQARTAVVSAIPHEMALLDLYSALHPLDAVTGATTVDDILDGIFSTFCIGK